MKAERIGNRPAARECGTDEDAIREVRNRRKAEIEKDKAWRLSSLAGVGEELKQLDFRKA